MSVYLVPVGRDRHELYCEVGEVESASGAGEGDGGGDDGWFAGMRARFRSMLAAAEAERRQTHRRRSGDATWGQRLRRLVVGAVAEAIAEQRLLWNLRRQHDACLVYPDDMEEERARTLLRDALQRDGDKHRRWLVIDVIVFAATGVLAIVPGPNLVAYYFAFRLVGHYFSVRGARHGRDGVEWTLRPSAPLSELRDAVELPRAERTSRLKELARRLELRHLAAFVERVAVSRA